MNKERESTKQSVRTICANNLFFTKLIFQTSPVYMCMFALEAIRGEITIFLEHTVGIGYVLEAAEFGYPFRKVALMIALLFACIVVGMIFTVFVGDFVGEKERPKIRQKIKLQLYENAQKLDLSCYDSPEFYNEQVLALSEVDKQIDRSNQQVQKSMAGLTVFISTGVFFIVKDVVALGFALVSLVISIVFTQKYNKLNFLERMESLKDSRKRDYIKRVFYLNNYAKEIRLNSGIADSLVEEFDEANDKVYQIEKKYAKKKFIVKFFSEHIAGAMVGDLFFVLYLVYQATITHELSYSTVAIMYASFKRLKEGMKGLTEVYPMASESSLYIDKIRRFLNYKPSIVSRMNLTPSQTARDIEFRNVSFSYNDNAKIIDDISFNVQPGEKIAIVGYNGAGKTTLVKLLTRLYDVNGGMISSGGHDIRDYNVSQYRKSIGTVFQDFQIFAGSVKENVVLDDGANCSVDKIEEALSEAGVLECVQEFEDGIEAVLTSEFSEKGVDLSGGERQKLAIARAFYKDSGLMILDEPSSALDPIAEYQLNHAMLQATGDRTVVFISHRLSTTRFVNRIIMLENGRIVEMGSHEELLRMNGKYAEMWKAQASAYITT